MSTVESIARPDTPPPKLPESERVARLRLARSVNVGPRTHAYLLRRFGNAVRALEALPSISTTGGNRSYVVCPSAGIETEIEAGQKAGAVMIVLGEAAYPSLLVEIDHPPPVIWVVGKTNTLQRPAIAVVGTRNASALGLRTARNLSRSLGEIGQVIVSGLARGIDAVAHEAAMDIVTIAVMAGGSITSTRRNMARWLRVLPRPASWSRNARWGCNRPSAISHGATV